MEKYGKITALYSRLSVGDEDRDGGESNSIQNQKIFLENYARQLKLTNIRHYIDDESGRFFDRSGYARMMEDIENGKIGVCIMKDLTRWGRDYLQVGNAMEVFRRNNVRFIAVNNGIDSAEPDTLEFAPFINIMSEWYAKDISKKVKTGIKTKGMSGKPICTEAPYGYVKDPANKDAHRPGSGVEPRHRQPGGPQVHPVLHRRNHLLLRDEQTASYTVEIWKRFRKWGGIPTGLTQNVKDLLSSREVENIFENSDYIYMLNQASGDRQILAKHLNISPHQLSYVTHSGEGLLFYGSVILPFVDRFPKDTELYHIMTTKLSE